MELTWGKDDHITGMFDIALATDVLYDVDLIEPLFKTVSKLIPSDGVFILSHIPRACYNEGMHSLFPFVDFFFKNNTHLIIIVYREIFF
jgi:hypothetical protein